MKSFEHRRQILLRQMLPHMLIGHPIASWLSRLSTYGLRTAEWVHYRTLPARARKHVSPDTVTFQHDPKLWSMDALWCPLASVPAAFGWYRLAAWFWKFGPWRYALAVGACGYEESVPCKCRCGCDGRKYSYEKSEQCFKCLMSRHDDMTVQQLNKIAIKKKQIKELEEELARHRKEIEDE